MAWCEMPSFCATQILCNLRVLKRDHSFETPEKMLSINFFNYPGRKIPFIIFGDADHAGANVCGKDYAKVIEENKLGPIWTSSLKRNPNSGYQVNLFVWTVDWEAYEKFATEHKSLWDTVKDKVKKTLDNNF